VPELHVRVLCRTGGRVERSCCCLAPNQGAKPGKSDTCAAQAAEGWRLLGAVVRQSAFIAHPGIGGASPRRASGPGALPARDC
jgi:hypothetical protein